MNPMSVSVVIPSYNSAGYVVDAVESVLRQTVQPDEILVVDDGSTDDTRERVLGYGGKVSYLFQENQGVSAARNHGVGRARGDWVAFLDADDVWHPRKLEIQTKALAKYSDLGLLGTETFDWPTPVLPPVDEWSVEPVVVVPWRQLAVRNYFTTSSLLVRRDLLQRAGPFDTKLQGPEDYDLWLRVAELAPVANLNLRLTGYRSVAGSLSKQAVRMQDGMRRILRKMDERQAWRGDWLLRRKAYSYCDYSCAYMFGAAGCYGQALGNVLRSLAGYPLPYQRGEVKMRWARLKLLGVSLKRLVRNERPPLEPAAAPAGETAACLL